MSDKILFVGIDKVGKTSLVQAVFGSNGEDNKRVSAIGAVLRTFKWGELGDKELAVWDATGSQQKNTVNAALYEDTRVAVIIASATDLDSLNNLSFYFDNIKFTKGARVILVLNKIDSDEPEVTSENVEDFAVMRGLKVIQTSATEPGNQGVKELKNEIKELLSQEKTDINPNDIAKKKDENCCSKCLIF